MTTSIVDVNMDLAFSMARISKGVRLKVGAVIVTAHDVVIRGVNGLPKPLGNELEFVTESGELVTKPTVIHAELNCILKAAREGISLLGSTVYLTHSPCEQCASMLVALGVSKVYYAHDYRITAGVDVLINGSVGVMQLEKYGSEWREKRCRIEQ